MHRRGSRWWRLVTLLVPALSAQTIDFNRDIRPIFSERCFACHGPDASHRQAGLRFDLEGGARAVGDEILRRIASDDPLERMPPPSSGKAKLTAHEIELLGAWIRAGRAVAAVLVVHPPAASAARPR